MALSLFVMALLASDMSTFYRLQRIRAGRWSELHAVAPKPLAGKPNFEDLVGIVRSTCQAQLAVDVLLGIALHAAISGDANRATGAEKSGCGHHELLGSRGLRFDMRD